MAEEKCLQCDQITNETFNRVIRDSCGHYKCRSCLLKEDIKCFACNENAKDFSTNAEKFDIIYNVDNKRSEVIEQENKSESNWVIDGSKEGHSCYVIVNQSISTTEGNVKKNSRRKKVLPSHILLESAVDESKSYLCTVCKKRFQARCQIKYHSFCNATKPFACTLCEKKFVKRCQLKYHLDVHSGNKTFICDNCNATFYNRSKLMRHMTIHTGSKTFQCTQCESTFSTDYVLKKHSLTHSNLKPFACKTCGTTFRDSSNLRKHEIHIHNVVPAEKHTCQECGKTFKRKWFLTKHAKTHTKIRPFSCSVCLRAFHNKKDRNRHEIIHADTRQFQCQICDNTFFKRKDNLERHFRNTHSDVDPSELQNLSVIKRVSAVDLSTEKTVPENSNKTAIKNSTQCNNTAVTASAKGFLESDTFDNQPLADDYYQNKSEFRNYKNYIPKEFNSLSKKDGESSQTIAKDINSDLISLRCVDTETNAIKLIDSPSRSEIIEANNKRQSVIFNPPACEGGCLQSSVSNILYPENNLISNEYFESTGSKLTILTNNETTDSITQDMCNNVFSKERLLEENDNTESSASNRPAATQSTSKTQKRTINVSEVYKQMFPNGSQTNFTNRRMSNPTKKVEPATKVSPYKYNDKMADTQQDGNPRKLTYIHKKVHYDLNNFLNKKTTSSLAFEDRYGEIVKEHNEQRNLNPNSPRKYNYSDKKDSKTYFSPESLELYKKILIPSYKGSSETTTSASASTHSETRADHSVDMQSDSLINVSENSVPPLAPISDHFPPTKTKFNDNSLEELPLPMLVPLGKKINVSVPGKTIPEAQTPSHSNDIHWRRRLAHSSNNV